MFSYAMQNRFEQLNGYIITVDGLVLSAQSCGKCQIDTKIRKIDNSDEMNRICQK